MTRESNRLIKELGRRRQVVLFVLSILFVALFARATFLQVYQYEFLSKQSAARHLRIIPTHAYRGMVVDRRGQPLAVSTPIQSVWLNPQKADLKDPKWRVLAKTLGIKHKTLTKRIKIHARRKSQFMYVKRQVRPGLIKKTKKLGLGGVHLLKEYKRHYPAGEVAAHIVGFTNVDDVGQEGVELAYNSDLSGLAGSRKVTRDGVGHIVETIENIRPTLHGKLVKLSIDKRLQYIAYRALKGAVQKAQAKSGSLIILDVQTGEVLAMVNRPSYNPNDRKQYHGDKYRNRAVTDIFEPGSTIKPFLIAAALQSGKVTSRTLINTHPGELQLAGLKVKDSKDYGILNVANILSKSSNVGTSKLALKIGSSTVWKYYKALGLGQSTKSGFPGESSGTLNHYKHWNQAETATHSYGYGLSMTALKLVQAYSIIANGGISRPVSILKVEKNVPGKRVMTPRAAYQIKRMLEKVVVTGTGQLASVSGYRVAGKTGTVRVLTSKGYSNKRHIALFAGLAPVSKPKLAIVVIVNEPGNNVYYGGKVAAPVFAEVMRDSLRILNISPDKLSLVQSKIIPLNKASTGKAVKTRQIAKQGVNRRL